MLSDVSVLVIFVAMCASAFAHPALATDMATIADATITGEAKATGLLGFLGIPQKSDWLTYVGSDVGLTSAWSEYKICVPVSKDLPVDKRDVNAFNWYVIEEKGKLKDWHFEILTTVSHTDKIPDYKQTCENVTTTDAKTGVKTTEGLCSNIETGFHWNNYTTQEWKRFEPVGSTFKAGACYNIRFAGSYAPAYGQGIRMDNVIQVAGNTYGEYVWWNGAWLYKALLTVTNPAVVQQKFVIPYNAHMLAGFDDLRFTDAAETTEYLHWIDRQNTTNSSSATVWVNVADAGDVYMYYGNPSATDDSDGQKTFEFFDDFNDNSINTTKWIVKGTNKVWEKNGYLAITGANAWLSGGVATKQTFDRTSTGYLMSLRYPIQETLADDIYLNSAYGDFTGTGNLQYVMNFGDAYGGVANITAWSQQYRNVSTSGWVTVVDGNENVINSRLNMYLNQTRGYQWYVNSSLMATTAAMDANNKNSYNFTVEQYVSTTNGTIDDFYVAKLATTPPTYTIGAEQIQNNPPTYTTVGTNNTDPAILDYVNFYSQWSDDIALDKFIFSWNASGAGCNAWSNDTVAAFTNNWTNTTKQIPAACALHVNSIGFKFYANDTGNKWNVTPDEVLFTAVPTWSVNQSSTPATYGTASLFNISWSVPTGSIMSFLESNFSGVATNYTMSNSYGGAIYNFSATMPVGTFYWKSYANDSSSNWNVTDTWTFTIGKASVPLTLANNLSWSGTYPAASNTTGNGCTGLTCTLLRNGTTVTADNNILLGVGIYNYTWFTAGNANYSANSTANTLVIGLGTSNVRTYLNGIDANETVTYPTSITATGNSTTTITPPTFTLYLSSLSNASNPATITTLQGADTYQIVYNTSGNANWTSASNNTLYLIVNKAANPVDIYLNGTQNANRTYTYPEAVNATGTVTGGTAELYRDGVSESNPENILLGVGSYAYKVNTSGDANYSANATGITYYANVGLGSNILNINIYPSDNISYPTTATTNCSSTLGSATLYRDGTEESNATYDYTDSSWTTNTGENHDGDYTTASRMYISGTGSGTGVTNFTLPTDATVNRWTINSVNSTLCVDGAVCNNRIGCYDWAAGSVQYFTTPEHSEIPDDCINSGNNVSIQYSIETTSGGSGQNTFYINEIELGYRLFPNTYNYLCNASAFGNYSANSTTHVLTVSLSGLLSNFTVTGNGVPLSTFDITFMNGSATYIQSTITGLIQVYTALMPKGTVTAQFHSSGYATQNTTYVIDDFWYGNFTLDLTPAGIAVAVHNEQNTSEPLVFNIQMTNGTCVVTNNSISTFSYPYSALCNGLNTVSISNNSYTIGSTVYMFPQRNYFLTVSDTVNSTLQGWLLRIDKGIYYAFVVSDVNGAPIQGVTVTVSRYLLGSYLPIEQELTDTSGTANFFLDYAYTYQVAVSAGGYTSVLFSLMPSTIQRTTYVRLTATGTGGAGLVNITTPMENISEQIAPLSYYHNNSIPLSFYISDTSADLQTYGWNISYQNSSGTYLLQSQNGSSPSGATLIYTTPNDTGTYVVESWFQKSNNTLLTNPVATYHISSYTIGFGSVPAGSLGIGRVTLELVAILVTLIVIAFFSQWSLIGGAVIGIIVLGIFTFGLGFVDWMTFALTMLTLMALILIRGGI